MYCTVSSSILTKLCLVSQQRITKGPIPNFASKNKGSWYGRLQSWQADFSATYNRNEGIYKTDGWTKGLSERPGLKETHHCRKRNLLNTRLQNLRFSRVNGLPLESDYKP